MSADPSTPVWRPGDDAASRLECLAAKLRSLGPVAGLDAIREAELIYAGIGAHITSANDAATRLYALVGAATTKED